MNVRTSANRQTVYPKGAYRPAIQCGMEWTRAVYLYRQELGSLDDELRDIAEEYVAERLQSTEPQLPVMIPYCLAEVFGIYEPETKSRALLLTLLVDHFTHVIDDVTDEKNNDKGTKRMHLASILHAKVSSTLNTLTDDPLLGSRMWQKYLSEASEGERYLLRHHGLLRQYTDMDFLMMAKRGGAAKITAWVFANIARKQGLLPLAEQGIDAASTGIQIIDDLLDWEEDFRAEIITWPIVLALSNCGPRVYDNVKLPNLRKAMYERTVVNTVLITAKRYFEKARNRFREIDAHKACELLAEIENEIDEIVGRRAGIADKKDHLGRDRATLIQERLQPKVQH